MARIGQFLQAADIALRQEAAAIVILECVAGTDTCHGPNRCNVLAVHSRSDRATFCIAVKPQLVSAQARVALVDPIGETLGAKLVVMLIGERPGLSAADSLGAYLTFGRRIGRQNADRNCVSNIRNKGLAPEDAGHKIAYLLGRGRSLARTQTPTPPTFLWFAIDKDGLSSEHLEPKSQIGLMRLLETSALENASDSEVGDIVIYAVSMERFAEKDMPITIGSSPDVSASVFDLGGWPAAMFTMAIDAHAPDDAYALELHYPDGRLIESIDSFPTRPDLFN